jgi:broad specificity phosphatase PhoE
MKQTIVYLIRHGAYENPEHLNPGRLPGFPLSSRGKQQIADLAKLLSTEPISSVISSPIERTLETAQIIAKKLNLPVTTDDRLLEVRSPFNGVPGRDVDALARAGTLYTQTYFDQGLERIPEMFHRMDDCIKDIVRKEQGKHVIVVSHGDPMMSVWFGYRDLDWSKGFAMGDWYLPMGTGFKIEFNIEGEPVTITKFPA